jgi:hypothetical protein
MSNERFFDEPRQRYGLVDGSMLDATDERRRQIHVELLFLDAGLRRGHDLMLAS